MNHSLEGFLQLLKEDDHIDQKLLTSFTMKVLAHNIEDGQYEVEDWSVEEDNYDWGIKDQALYELEYESHYDLKITENEPEWRTLSVKGFYSEDYYGEVDLEIMLEVIDD